MLNRVIVVTVCVTVVLSGCGSRKASSHVNPLTTKATAVLQHDGLPAEVLSRQNPPDVVPAAFAIGVARHTIPPDLHVDEAVLATVTNEATGHSGLCWLVIATAKKPLAPPPTSQGQRLPSHRPPTMSITILDARSGFLFFTAS